MSLFAGRSLDELSQAEGVQSFQGLREDLFYLAHASYLAELTREFLPEREPNQAVFDLLLRSYANLESGHEPMALTHLFELRLLDLAGFKPSLEACLACGRPPGLEGAVFSPADGGCYCGTCAPAGAATIRLSQAAIAAMSAGLRGDEGFLGALAMEERRAIQRALRTFIEARLDKGLRSLKFLAEILTGSEGGAGSQHKDG